MWAKTCWGSFVSQMLVQQRESGRKPHTWCFLIYSTTVKVWHDNVVFSTLRGGGFCTSARWYFAVHVHGTHFHIVFFKTVQMQNTQRWHLSTFWVFSPVLSTPHLWGLMSCQVSGSLQLLNSHLLLHVLWSSLRQQSTTISPSCSKKGWCMDFKTIEVLVCSDCNSSPKCYYAIHIYI